MANPVTVADLEARYRPLTAAETIVATALLADAWAIVLAHVSDAETRLDADPPTHDVGVVRAVVSAMVLRVLRNPDGKRSESIDDYSWIRDNALSAGALYLSDAELELLTPGSSSGAFTIRPFGEPGYATTPDTLDWA